VASGSPAGPPKAEIASALAKLDDAIARLSALRIEAEDPDGLVRFTFGEDCRPLSLFIADFGATSLTHLALERRLNGLFAAANEAVRLSRYEFWAGFQQE
jgi:hypothetical protein